MGYNHDRDAFIAACQRAGVPLPIARAAMRYAATVERLAVAQCNGDFPADDGKRVTRECPDCGRHWAPSSFRRGKCQDCRTEELLRALFAPYGADVTTSGDPRGYTTKVRFRGIDRGNTWAGDEWFGVPVRG